MHVGRILDHKCSIFTENTEILRQHCNNSVDIKD